MALGKANMEIVITANSDSAVRGLNQTAQAVEQTAKKFPVLGSAVLDAKEKIETITAKIYLLDKAGIQSKVGENLAKQLQIAKTELKDLEKQAGLTGEVASNAFGGLYNKLRQIAYILPGIGIAGLIGGIVSGITSLLTGVDKELDTTKKASQEAQKAVQDVISSFAKEGAQVDSIVNSLKRGNLTRLETKSAIEELQRISPQYFGNLDKEHLSISQLTKDYAAYNQQVVTSIETQLKLKDITDIIAQRLDFEKSAKSASAEFNQLIASGKSLAEIAKIANDRINEQAKSNIQLLQSEKGRYATNKDLVAGLGLEAGALLEIVQLRQKEADILATVTNFGKISLKDTKEKAEEVKLVVPARIDFDLADTSLADTFQTLEERLKGKLPKMKPIEFGFPKIKLDTKTFDDFERQVKGALDSTIGGIAESLGEAIAGGGFDKALNSLGNVLSGALKAIGQAYVKAGTAVLIAKVTFEKFLIANPVLSIAAGVALEVLAGVVKNSVSKTKAFATGGIVTGPTLGLVGEAGPEVIFPLERLNQFIKGARTDQNLNVGGELKVRGSDLVTVMNRQNKLNGLSS